MITFYKTLQDDSAEFDETNAIGCKVYAGGGTTGELTYYLTQGDQFMIITHKMLQAIMEYGLVREVEYRNYEESISYSPMDDIAPTEGN